MDRQATISIEILNRRPVELVDYAQSMAALGQEYARFIANGENAARPEDVKLYVKEVRQGSIITEVVALAPLAIPFIEHAWTVVEFSNTLISAMKWLKGDQVKPPEQLDKTSLQNISQIVEPVAKDNGSQLNIGTLNVTGGMTLNFSSTDANALQNAVRRMLESEKETVTGRRTKVLMYWAQTNWDANSRRGDRVRIESIYNGDVKVIFDDDGLKLRAMFADGGNPYLSAYVVDVDVETIKGRPVLYKVVSIHSVEPRDDV